ncbi:hypothetical protein RYX36_002574, partial [Vicia faba]
FCSKTCGLRLKEGKAPHHCHRALLLKKGKAPHYPFTKRRNFILLTHLLVEVLKEWHGILDYELNSISEEDYNELDYKTTTSPPIYISPLDLGPKFDDKLGVGFQEYRKIYGQNYCLGLLNLHISDNYKILDYLKLPVNI